MDQRRCRGGHALGVDHQDHGPAGEKGQVRRRAVVFALADEGAVEQPHDALADDELGAGAKPGHIIDDRLSVACGDGALRPTRLQRPGRAVMAVDEFLRGYQLGKGGDLAVPPGRDGP